MSQVQDTTGDTEPTTSTPANHDLPSTPTPTNHDLPSTHTATSSHDSNTSASSVDHTIPNSSDSASPPSSTASSSVPPSSSTPPPPSSVPASSSSAPPLPSSSSPQHSDEMVVFEGKVLTKQDRLVILTLRNSVISWDEKGPRSVALATIIGVTTIKKFFTIHYIFQEKKSKVKETLTFKCENESIPKQWAEKIHNTMTEGGYGSRGCRVVFVVNPFSGTRKALSVLASVRHLFDIAGMHVTVTETNAAGHAREIGRTFDIKAVDRLVCVSGDGLFNELINGIMDRPDWREAGRIPLGIIPGGSGNGLAYSLRNTNVTEAAFAIIKGHARPFDILRSTQNGVSLYGCLTLTWAMISDVDIESDSMRWMGPIRFTIGALKRIMSLRKYKGKITFLPAPDAEQPHPCRSYQECTKCLHEIPAERDLQSCLYDPSQPPPEGWQVLDDEFILFIATNVSHISNDFIASPHAHLSDGALDLVLIRAKPEVTRANMISLMLDTETGKYITSPLVEHFKIKALYLEPGQVVNKKHPEDIGEMAVDGEKIPYAPVGLEVFRGLLSIMCYD